MASPPINFTFDIPEGAIRKMALDLRSAERRIAKAFDFSRLYGSSNIVLDSFSLGTVQVDEVKIEPKELPVFRPTALQQAIGAARRFDVGTTDHTKVIFPGPLYSDSEEFKSAQINALEKEVDGFKKTLLHANLKHNELVAELDMEKHVVLERDAEIRRLERMNEELTELLKGGKKKRRIVRRGKR